MTITVTAPNGASVNFPDGTDNATINNVMAQNFRAAAPDKYEQAAIDERAAGGGNTNVNAAGRLLRNVVVPAPLRMMASAADDLSGGYISALAQRGQQGATLGARDEMLAALETPSEMYRRGTFNPLEGYNYAKAREDLSLKDARAKTGAVGTAAEIAGGGATAAMLGPYGAVRFLSAAPGLLARTAAMGADASALGSVAGFNEGNNLGERATNAAIGFGAGAVLGAGAPVAAKVIGGVLSPVVANIRAKFNPKGFGESQVARAIHESGRAPDQMSMDAIQAANEGQGAFTLADAMGNAGQRLLSTVTRASGEGRTAAVQALDSRQGDQGRRLATAFREAFDAPQTAEATRADMVRIANFDAGRNYAPVKRETTPIDVTYPVAIANRAISPAADRLAITQGRVPTDIAARATIEAQEAALRDPIASALKEARSYLAAPTLTSSNVNQAFRAKTNIDQMIATAAEQKRGALVNELTPIRDALDEALARTSSSYSSARDAYRLAQQRIEALDLGKALGSKPVRPEDAIRQFNALDDEAQVAFRRGYVDPQISQVQNAAFGANKSRPFTSDATRQEFDAFATPGRADQLQRQIGREQTMFETRNAAMGGSKTADNLADEAAMGVDPHIVGQIMTGNWHGAVKTALAAGQNIISGNTPAVRKEVANILLQTGENISPAELNRMVDETVRRIQFVQAIARKAGSGAAGGAAVAVPNVQRR